jgi:hypothetical protein
MMGLSGMPFLRSSHTQVPPLMESIGIDMLRSCAIKYSFLTTKVEVLIINGKRTRQRLISPTLGDKIPDFFYLKGPIQLICQNFGDSALVVTSFVLLKGTQTAIDGFEQKRLAATVIANNQVNRAEIFPTNVDQRTKVFEFYLVDHRSPALNLLNFLSSSGLFVVSNFQACLQVSAQGIARKSSSALRGKWPGAGGGSGGNLAVCWSCAEEIVVRARSAVCRGCAHTMKTIQLPPKQANRTGDYPCTTKLYHAPIKISRW